ncbi:hypothetical protein AVEN_190168-1 [Araneus ventricosus]|uniref:DUF4817 domain-containing protein n=1 Tax=Araneus ventricosus TaxID=182803 RepID=A0A4Y2G0H9_ARAVE|nr:hypothetical protein AVEN_190168-1 [Araneus ventricosus]
MKLTIQSDSEQLFNNLQRGQEYKTKILTWWLEVRCDSEYQVVGKAHFPAMGFCADEATFSRVIERNWYPWSFENPRVIRQQTVQQYFSINVWAGIIGVAKLRRFSVFLINFRQCLTNRADRFGRTELNNTGNGEIAATVTCFTNAFFPFVSRLRGMTAVIEDVIKLRKRIFMLTKKKRLIE